MKFLKVFSFFLLFNVISFSLNVGADSIPDLFQNYSAPHFKAPDYLTYSELVRFSENPKPTKELEKKLDAILRTPFVSNEAFYEGKRPHRPSRADFGPYLRAVSWNIEKSYRIPEAITAFTSATGYVELINQKKFPPGSKKFHRAFVERDLLKEVDLAILQEMEVGIKRSGYRDAAREMAQAMGMNYAYAVQYLEVDPVQLGKERIYYEEGGVDTELEEYYRVDPEKYKGLFGSAVLSRYPIKFVEVIPLKNQGYDWYRQEKNKTTFLEKARRFGAKTVFLSHMHREIKLGGRHYFRVDLHVPGLPNDTLTVINIHLEIKCLPKAREEQMREILSYMEKINNPVIMAGDFNSAPSDLSPTSTIRVIKRTATDPEFWLSVAIRVALQEALLINGLRSISNITKNYQNPPAIHIPWIMPNKVRGLFKTIRDFRFEDGGAFDFRGDPERSANDHGYLSNSNEMDFWKYKVTFRTRRTIAHLVGKFRLDWVFVKAFLKEPFDKSGSYRFAPHFGRTLNHFNDVLRTRISDHDPNVVDLFFEEPLRVTL